MTYLWVTCTQQFLCLNYLRMEHIYYIYTFACITTHIIYTKPYINNCLHTGTIILLILLFFYLSVCRSSISPKPGSTQVSAWSRSASRCSSTSSTLSGARPLQTSTAMWRRRKSQGAPPPQKHSPVWLTGVCSFKTPKKINNKTDSFIHFSFGLSLSALILCVTEGRTCASIFWRTRKKRSSRHVTQEPPPGPQTPSWILSCLQHHQCHAPRASKRQKENAYCCSRGEEPINIWVERKNKEKLRKKKPGETVSCDTNDIIGGYT